MATLATKLRQLTQLRCALLETAYNPTSARTGAKYLRARLRGPGMMQYYPARMPMRDIKKLAWEFNIPDPREEERLEDVEALKRRGKGTPKKKKGPPDGKKKKKK